jgi:hypothetical protein
MKRTYVDSDVLMEAFRGTTELAVRAMSILDDPERRFVSSMFSKLELLPKPRFERRAAEVEFYEAFYASCELIVEGSADTCRAALEQAERHGLSAVDALHVASAVEAEAEELVTGELPTKPIHRASSVRVVALR